MARKKAAAKAHADDHLSIATLTIFSLPCVIQSLLFVPVMSVFPTLYEKYYAVSFASVGAMVALSRSADAFIDPLVAYLSDRTRTPIGPRKPWLIMSSAASGAISASRASRARWRDHRERACWRRFQASQ